MNPTQMHKIAATFRTLMNISIEMNKKGRNYGTDILIYPAEIHYLVAISESHIINVTELAQKMGVTKGAVSQMLTRLAKKDLIDRFKKGSNDKSVYVCLSNLGKLAESEHHKIETEFFTILYNNLADVTEEEANQFHSILKNVVKSIKM